VFAKARRLGNQLVELVSRRLDQPGVLDIGYRRNDHQITQSAQQITQEALRVLPRFDDLVNSSKSRRPIAR